MANIEIDEAALQTKTIKRGGRNKYVIFGAPRSGRNAPANNLGRFTKWMGRNNPIALKHDNPTYEQKKEVKLRDKGRCRLCGSSLNTEIHHNIRRRIGDSRPGNLWTLCQKHHREFVHGTPAVWTWPLKAKKPEKEEKKWLTTTSRS